MGLNISIIILIGGLEHGDFHDWLMMVNDVGEWHGDEENWLVVFGTWLDYFSEYIYIYIHISHGILWDVILPI